MLALWITMETRPETMPQVQGARTSFHPNKKLLNPAWVLSNRGGKSPSQWWRQSSVSSKPFQKKVASRLSCGMWINSQRSNMIRQLPSSEETTPHPESMEMMMLHPQSVEMVRDKPRWFQRHSGWLGRNVHMSTVMQELTPAEERELL